MKRVMAFGTFDLLHKGHEYFLEQAKKQGDELVVVIARDSTVLKTKGKQPVHDELTRQKNVQNIPRVDRAVLGSKDDVYLIIKEFAPDVICLGYDQTHFIDKLEEKLKEFGLKTRIIRIESFKPELYKTSILREN